MTLSTVDDESGPRSGGGVLGFNRPLGSFGFRSRAETRLSTVFEVISEILQLPRAGSRWILQFFSYSARVSSLRLRVMLNSFSARYVSQRSARVDLLASKPPPIGDAE